MGSCSAWRWARTNWRTYSVQLMGDRPGAAPRHGVVATLCEYANANPEGVLVALAEGDTVVFDGGGLPHHGPVVGPARQRTTYSADSPQSSDPRSSTDQTSSAGSTSVSPEHRQGPK